jgi:glycosyltransferase involved in cell wall biosynthesis
LTLAAVSETSDKIEVAPLDLTALILTFNESRHLARAIGSVRSIAREVLVIDSFSTDNTVAIAEALGARVLQNRFINHSKQFQWGLDNGQITTSWILRLDADEILEPDLVRQIGLSLPGLTADVAGVNFDRKHIFMGRWIKHGGRYPLRMLRLWRRGQGRVEQRWMDEHIVVWGGRTVTFAGGFADVNLNDLTFFTDKHNKYATREALEILNQRWDLFPRDEAFHSAAVSRQAATKRLFKERFYNRLPFWVGPMMYFLYRYFIQLGFLDGRPGLIYHFLQGYWYRFLVGAKVVELEAELADCTTNEQRIVRLARVTGHKLDSTS